jgi:alkylation response protein AidB-like acyl-CoA dehydrogenase
MAKYAGVDFIDFDSQLNDEEKLVRQTAREFVENEIIPIIEKHTREATFPMHLVAQLGELGFFGASLQGYGCAGMSSVAYGLMTQELERGDSGIRSFVSVQSALVMYPIYAFGSEEQKNKWLPLLQQGKKIGCFGLTEPQFGSNPGGMLTRAVKKGNKYVLNGEKMWITSGSIADVAVVWAKCEDEKIRGFLVEKGTQRSAELFESGTLRNWLGRAGRGDGVLRHGVAVRENAQTVCQQADCFASVGAGKIGVDDYRNCERSIARSARGKNQGRWKS